VSGWLKMALQDRLNGWCRMLARAATEKARMNVFCMCMKDSVRPLPEISFSGG